MANLKQSTTYTRAFMLISSTDHITGLTGATASVSLSKAGGTFASAGGTITEIANGWYKIALTTTDTGTLGDLAFHVTATGADPNDFVDQVTANILGDTLPANTTQLNGQTVSASGTVTFPNATLASTTNITAGTITTVTTVTNQLTAAQIATGVWQDSTSGDFTTASSIGKALYIANIAPGAAGGHFIAGTNAATTITGSLTTTFTGSLTGSVASVTGAVGSVTGAVGSVSGAVASVTGNVGGNVVGSVASVTGAVGSVTGNVGGNVTGSVGSVSGVTFPTHFSSLSITAGGLVGVDGTSSLTEAYSSKGSAFTLSQCLYDMHQLMFQQSITSTTLTVQKRDGTTAAKTITLNSATAPTSGSEAS